MGRAAREAGGKWPKQTLWGKSFLLAKVDEVTTDPMDYRILLILPRLYMRWAASCTGRRPPVAD